MDLCDIYTKDEVPRQRDYSLPEYYPNGAVRSKCALRRLPVQLARCVLLKKSLANDCHRVEIIQENQY